MVKIGLWLGIPSVVTFMASAQTVRYEFTVLIFALALLSLFVGIGPYSRHKDSL